MKHENSPSEKSRPAQPQPMRMLPPDPPDMAPSGVLAQVPRELSFDWVYFPPALVTVTLGFVVTFILTRLLNRLRLSTYFWYPELAFVGFWILFTSLIGLIFLPI